ncbi:MAG: hypothetical protein ABI647_11890 [Gemmatimonadota bacterium]
MTEPHAADLPAPSSRRDFVSYLALGGIAAAAAGCAGPHAATTTPAPVAGAAATPPGSQAPAAHQPPAAPIQLPPPKDDGPWDMTWLDRVDRARFKLMFDVGAYLGGGGLYYTKNYLNGMRDGWGIEAPDVIPLIGVSGDAYPIVFNDQIWEKYRYGASSKTNDPRTGQPATRNVYWKPRAGESMAEFGVDVLQARGAQLLFCNNVFRGVIRGVMRESGRPYGDVRSELKAGFLPGVIVVPAMVAAMAMAQARGSGYVFAGV